MTNSSNLSLKRASSHHSKLPDALRKAVTQANKGEALEALGELVREHGMVAFADEVGLTRLTLYKTLKADGNPKLATVLAVLEGLGLELQVVPRKASRG